MRNVIYRFIKKFKYNEYMGETILYVKNNVDKTTIMVIGKIL